MLNKPKQTKFPSHHNLKKSNSFKLNTSFIKHKIGLYATQGGILTAAQINAATLAIKRKLKENSSLIIRIFPHLPVTKRPLEMPLGRGKAAISY